MSWEKESKEIIARRKEAKAQGGKEAIARQHAKGRLTLRERIDSLLDAGSFDEIGAGAGEALFDEQGKRIGFQPANFLLGFGKIAGRPVLVGGEDFTLKGGSPNAAGLRKSVYAETLALRRRIPLVRLHEGGGGSVAGPDNRKAKAGARARAGGDAVFAGPRFLAPVDLLHMVPVASAALGPVAGLPAARFVAAHFRVMTKNAQLLVAGPPVVERALNVSLTKEQLGGGLIHLKNGVCDNQTETEEEALAQIGKFLSYLPDNVWQRPPAIDSKDDPARAEKSLLSVIPRERRRAYAIRPVLEAILDKGSFFELSRRFAPGLVTALARLNGEPVGVIANDCMHYAGATTTDSARKLRRFVDFCSCFHLPVINFTDEPGFMIGPDAEKEGVIREGMAAMSAVMQSRSPWAAVMIRKCFGVAGALHFARDAYVLAWPSAESGAVPVEGGVAVAFRREIEAAPDPAAKRAELEAMLAQGRSPFPRAENFSVHELIAPDETRAYLGRWLRHALAAYHAKPLEPFTHAARV